MRPTHCLVTFQHLSAINQENASCQVFSLSHFSLKVTRCSECWKRPHGKSYICLVNLHEGMAVGADRPQPTYRHTGSKERLSYYHGDTTCTCGSTVVQ